jgi:D-aminopeptidase
MPGRRWRDLGGSVGLLEPGPRNAITDVPGVRVGHAQAASGEATGVSVVAPPSLPAPAGVAVVNGTGELTGKLELDEWGLLSTPVYLCGTHAVGTVYQAALAAAGGSPEHVLIPVVGECDDSDMADSRSVVAADVEAALAALGEEVAEGSVGAGTGMTCFDYAGGIGSASRRLSGGHTVGVLLLCNFGDRARLRIAPGRPGGSAGSAGSCIAICATDAPLGAWPLRRLALRPLLGLAAAGSYGGDGSGEIGIAFGPAAADPVALDMNELFAAACEAGEEAVYNCLVAARPGRRRDGREQVAFLDTLGRP